MEYHRGVRISFLIAVVAFCLVPVGAHAWGPATHLEYGLSALTTVTQLLPWVQELLQVAANDFLYGCIAADITLGKRHTHYTQNCHNWSVGIELFDAAKTDSQKAFMLGYLSHLAADTVSHNYFVPYYSLKSFRATSLRHTYWEMRMEAHASEDAHQRAQGFADPCYLENDKLLERELARTIFSFKTNKRIFNFLLSLQRLAPYHRFNRRLTTHSQWELGEAAARHFKSLSMTAVMDFLANYTDATCLRADPTGQKKILYSRETARQLKEYDKRRLLSPEGETKFFADLKTAMETGLYQPILLPKIESYLD